MQARIYEIELAISEDGGHEYPLEYSDNPTLGKGTPDDTQSIAT